MLKAYLILAWARYLTLKVELKSGGGCTFAAFPDVTIEGWRLCLVGVRNLQRVL